MPGPSRILNAVVGAFATLATAAFFAVFLGLGPVPGEILANRSASPGAGWPALASPSTLPVALAATAARQAP